VFRRSVVQKRVKQNLGFVDTRELVEQREHELGETKITVAAAILLVVNLLIINHQAIIVEEARFEHLKVGRDQSLVHVAIATFEFFPLEFRSSSKGLNYVVVLAMRGATLALQNVAPMTV